MAQDLTVTDQMVAAFRDSASKEDRFLNLYREHDYLTAYSKHTDMRVEASPKWAIGRGDEWESHGRMQLEFLKAHGLKPSMRVLDYGCGVGRAARRLVPYMYPGHYYGVDISPGAVDHAIKLASAERWAARNPSFAVTDGVTIPFDVQFDIAWAHSVFTHLPEELIAKVAAQIRDRLTPDGVFFFTYKPADRAQRSGLKQFQYPFAFFEALAKDLGMTAKAIKKKWPASQMTGSVRWGATASLA